MEELVCCLSGRFVPSGCIKQKNIQRTDDIGSLYRFPHARREKRQFRISPYSEHRITLLSAQDNTTKILIADICHILLSTVEHVK